LDFFYFLNLLKNKGVGQFAASPFSLLNDILQPIFIGTVYNSLILFFY
jgi:hypothetical protein